MNDAMKAVVPLMELEGVVKHFPLQRESVLEIFTDRPVVHAVDGISFTIGANETFGLVGESGSGKSTVGKLIGRLVEPTAGQIRLQGEDWLAYRGEELRRRRRHVQKARHQANLPEHQACFRYQLRGFECPAV